jgi:hypothetical protein
MPQFPKFTAPATGSAGSGVARATNIGALTETGAVQVAQATAGLGREVTRGGLIADRVLDEKLDYEANAQSRAIKANSDDFINKQQLALEEDATEVKSIEDQKKIMEANAAEYDEAFDGWMASASPRAQQKIALWRDGVKVAYDDHMRRLTSKKWQNFIVRQEEKSMDEMVSGGNIEGALAVLDEMEKGFETKDGGRLAIISPEWADRKRAEFEKRLPIEALKQRMNQAAVNPEGVLGAAVTERESREQGNDPSLGWRFIDNTSLVQVERYAENRIEELERDAIEANEAIQKEEEDKLFVGLEDGTSSTADVVSSAILEVEAKRRLLDDEAQFTKMDLEQSWPLTDNDDTVQELETMLTDQRSGRSDFNEVSKKINEAAADRKLKKATRDSLRSRARKGGSDAIDDSVNAFTQRVQNALTGRLTERQARLTARSAARDLTRDEQREAASVEFMRQVGFEQLDLFKAELNSKLREGGREAISGIEAEALAAEIWEKYKNKTDSQRIREFKDFTGRQVPRPDGFPKGTWEAISLEERAEVTSALSNGAEMSQVLEAVAK